MYVHTYTCRTLGYNLTSEHQIAGTLSSVHEPPHRWNKTLIPTLNNNNNGELPGLCQ
jgi:hypothetical protein